MFDLIAPRYDRFTRVFSFGMDAGWKRELIAMLDGRVPANARILDLACGTGDLTFASAASAPAGEVIGIDVSSRMIELARARVALTSGARQASDARQAAVRFAVGDISALDFPDASMDAATAGYALRNVPDYRATLREIARVLRPGGLLLTLDFYRPESAIWRTLFLSYLAGAGNAVGWLWHREPVAYGYIAPSIDRFVSWREFSRALADAGLEVDRVRRKLLGGVAIHVARKPGRPG